MAFRLWSFRPIATANAATLLSGMVVIGLTAFLPMYVQGVLDQSPLVAGFTLTVMVLGWPVGATLGARSFNRFGLRAILLCGGALLPVGGIVFVLLRPGSSPLLGGLGSLVTGLGMGLLSTAAIMVVQSSVGWAERGAATASNIFARSLGSTLGATVLGAVLNNSLAAGGSPRGGVARSAPPVTRPAGDAGRDGGGTVRPRRVVARHVLGRVHSRGAHVRAVHVGSAPTPGGSSDGARDCRLAAAEQGGLAEMLGLAGRRYSAERAIGIERVPSVYKSPLTSTQCHVPSRRSRHSSIVLAAAAATVTPASTAKRINSMFTVTFGKS